MTYFSKFPKIPYSSDGTKVYKMTPDLLRRVGFRQQAVANAFRMRKYYVRAGETPESVADKFYGDPRLHWVILISNNIIDRYHDWPLTEGQLMQFVDDKYDNPNGVHHYEISQTSGDTDVKINIGTDKTDYPSATTITNYEYEVERQDGISEVSILEAESLQQFVKEFEAIIREK